MSVFRNYNANKAGNVNANAFPRVYSLPWEPTQRNIRSNPNIPSQPQRIQPNERGTFFPTSASDGGTLAPASSSSGGCSAGCGSCTGCGGAAPPPPTSVDNSTGHAFPLTGSTPKLAIHPMAPRVLPRGVGGIRSMPYGGIRGSVRGTKAMPISLMGGVRTR